MERAQGIDSSPKTKEALSEANAHLAYVHDELEHDGSRASIRWALATGYLSVLSSLHRAEEALIIVEPADAVVGDALHDALSLEGLDDRQQRPPPSDPALGARSHLPGHVRVLDRRDSRANEARAADDKMSRARHSVRSGSPSTSTSRTSWAASCVPGTGSSGRCSPSAGTTYLLLGLALAPAVPVPQILAVAVFYLVGAIVGLFNRLGLEVGRSGAVEDFGLSMARLVVTPLVSGLAAVGGRVSRRRRSFAVPRWSDVRPPCLRRSLTSLTYGTTRSGSCMPRSSGSRRTP